MVAFCGSFRASPAEKRTVLVAALKTLLLPARFSTVPTVAIQLTILGSGSGGNSAYVETDETRILIDAGFSAGKSVSGWPASAGRRRV